jgi:hypothetical protein
MGLRGSEEQFSLILVEITKNVKRYEAGEIKHNGYAQQCDNIFASFGWDKAEFTKELNARLGKTNRTETAPIVPKKRTTRPVKKPSGPPPF